MAAHADNPGEPQPDRSTGPGAANARPDHQTKDLPMIPRLTDALDFHGQALTLRAERQKLIASNIANADTPGYQARDFDFGAALRAARAGRDGSGLGEGIARGVMNPGGRAAPAMQYLHPAQTNLDGNSVDMNRERASFMDNALKFDATLRFINGNVRTTLDAMKSPNSP